MTVPELLLSVKPKLRLMEKLMCIYTFIYMYKKIYMYIYTHMCMSLFPYIKYFVLFTCILLFGLFVFVEFASIYQFKGSREGSGLPVANLFRFIHLNFQPLFIPSAAVMPK